MNPELLTSIISNVLVPEVAGWLHRRHAAGEPPPTEEELRAHLLADADRYISEGEAFLTSKGSAPAEG